MFLTIKLNYEKAFKFTYKALLTQPYLLFRYVDDRFAIFTDPGLPTFFLKVINSCLGNIHFANEIEINVTFSFFGCVSQKSEIGHITSNV